jgi:hypothetical protein
MATAYKIAPVNANPPLLLKYPRPFITARTAHIICGITSAVANAPLALLAPTPEK